MKETNMVLTSTDRQILDSYKVLAKGLADYLGNGYEIVVHSLENLESSVVKIINGHYTNRKEGSPITDLGLSMVKDINDNKDLQYISYFNKNSNGEPLKSCSISIQGENGRLIGLFCMNLYLNTPFTKILENFTSNNDNPNSPIITETFVENTSDLILESLDKVTKEVYQNKNITTANKNKEIILKLYEKGIFNLKDSVVNIANLMNISKNTVYMHIRNFNKK